MLYLYVKYIYLFLWLYCIVHVKFMMRMRKILTLYKLKHVISHAGNLILQRLILTFWSTAFCLLLRNIYFSWIVKLHLDDYAIISRLEKLRQAVWEIDVFRSLIEGPLKP